MTEREAILEQLRKVPQSRIVIITGPSAAGKTSILELFLGSTRNVNVCVSYTTRAPRMKKSTGTMEVHGVDYFFVSEEEFKSMRKGGYFVEAKKNGIHFYGTPLSQLEEHGKKGGPIVFDLDVEGAIYLQGIFEECSWPVMSSIILPPSLEVLRHRLEARGTEDAAERERRLERAGREIDMKDKFTHRFWNHDLDGCFSVFLGEFGHFENNGSEVAV